MIRLHEPTFGEEEITAAVDVMRSTKVTQGAKVKELEQAFAPGLDQHVVASNSGSSANLLAISALVADDLLKPGDGVIVSALSWSTTVWPLVQHNLVPIIVDCDPDTLNIDPWQVAEVVNTKMVTHQIKAVMPVHVYGNPCSDLDQLAEFCAENNLLLIEDCCEAMGAEFGDAAVGSFGDMATFSTYFSHHITTLEGGLTVTDNAKWADIMRIQRSHGWLRDVETRLDAEFENPDLDPNFTFVLDGYNLRLNEVQAAIGLVQLPKLGAFVDRRRAAWAMLKERFERWPFLRSQEEADGGRSSCFGFTIVVEDDAPVTAKQIRRHLSGYGIESRPIICGNIALQPAMKRFRHVVHGDLKEATKVMRDGFSIPCHQDIGEAEVDEMVRAFEALLA